MTPYQYGVQAFEDGMERIPARDLLFLDKHIKGLGVGEGAADILLEWLKGYDEAYLKDWDFTYRAWCD
jgi:hypothetical protein